MSESCLLLYYAQYEISGVLIAITSFTVATVNARGRKWEAAYFKDR